MTGFPARHQGLQAVKHGLKTFIDATKPRHKPDLRLVPPPVPISLRRPEEARIDPVDPVELTVMAVNRLGLATFRTSAIGKATTVAVPDARTAEIFRAALREMQKARGTDRLVDVVVSGGDGPATGSGRRGRDLVEA